jgi:NAD(P)-dependent dehydrogenase (short-subunit alcohol dehydrogenase family)
MPRPLDNLPACRLPAGRTLRVISFNAAANLPQAIDQIRDEDWDRLVELNLTSCLVYGWYGANVFLVASHCIPARQSADTVSLAKLTCT